MEFIAPAEVPGGTSIPITASSCHRIVGSDCIRRCMVCGRTTVMGFVGVVGQVDASASGFHLNRVTAGVNGPMKNCVSVLRERPLCDD